MPLSSLGCRILRLSGCVLLLACPSASQNQAEDTEGDEAVYSLDFGTRSVTQELRTEPGEPEKQKFVEIEITEVVNPEDHPLLFEVHYRDGEREEEVFLGTFGLFPSDNPGKFIVATRGLLRAEGSVVLSLLAPEGIGEDAEIRVRLKRLRFREE